jgi:hypothetical protein
LRVLFIGNSFTEANAMIYTLARMADTGYEPGLPLYPMEYAPGGSTLAQAARDPRLMTLLSGVRWDDVVLQEQSQIPEILPEENPGRYDSIPAARTLGQLIRKDHARAFVFETWGYLHGDPLNAFSDTYGAMQQRLHAGYVNLARAAHAILAPVGDIWQQAIAQQPDLGLWAADGKHPSELGSYLTASVFYGLLEDMQPGALYYNGGLPEATANEVLWEAGIQLSKTWELRNPREPAIPVTAEHAPYQIPAKPTLQRARAPRG